MKYDWYGGEGKNEVLRETIRLTLTELEKEYGSKDVQSWRHPIFWRYYDPAAVAENPDKKPFRSRIRRGSTAAKLGLAPPYVPANLSESWNMLIKLSRDMPDLYDSTPTGGQNQFISATGQGNPNIADQVMLHANFEFKQVALQRERVAENAKSVERIDMSVNR
jgi:hypothetical protein